MNPNTKQCLFALLILSAVAAGCSTPKSTDAGPELSFEVQMQVNTAQEFHASLGVENRGPTAFPGDETFNGEMELRYADGTQAGELRARAETVQLSRLEPGETAWPVAWRAHLDPGKYILTWGTETYGSCTVGFQIVERNGRLYLDS
jgi:hypothetical protein